MGIKEKKHILFVVINMTPRVTKLARALTKRGKKVSVLLEANTRAHSAFRLYIDELQEICDVCLYCKSVEELVLNSLKAGADIIHIFAHAWNFSSFFLFRLKNKYPFPPIVFENYDIANGMYTNFTEQQFAVEKFCMENADGVCGRGYETDYLKEELHFQFKSEPIKFFDYCKSENSETDSLGTEKEEDRPLSLCYAGGIATETRYPGASYACLLELGEKCAKNNCHFHIYPSVWDEGELARYIEMDRTNEFFHLHQQVAFKDLGKELSQYDYGVHPIKNDFHEKLVNGYITKTKLIYTVTNKFYDYLDAGLPIIAASPVKFARYFENEGVLVNYTLEEYDFEELKKRRDELRKQVELTRKKLSIDNNIGRLIEYYDSL